MSAYGPASIESVVRMLPSHVTAYPRTRENIECGCCHRIDERGYGVHPILGLLCLACTRVFDQRFPTYTAKYRDADSCPLCFTGECVLHD